MKLLLVGGLHHKNHNALLHYKDIELTTVNSIEGKEDCLDQFDIVYSPSSPIDARLYPQVKFIFGPHFSVFPDHRLDLVKHRNCVYILPSKWPCDWWRTFSICDQTLNLQVLPFGVDTDKFIETTLQKSKIFVYHKNRSPQDLANVKCFLQDKGLIYEVFCYGSYNEADYLAYLKESKFGIWIDAHESQGFALQEALSCNVPLIVWSVNSMNQEYNTNYADFPATTIPYWDSRCGEYFFDFEELKDTFQQFLSNLHIYKPREFILENLSIQICEEKFLLLVDKFKC